MRDPHFLLRLGDARPEAMTPALIEAHVAWLRRLHAAGQLVLCGPCADGSAIIVLRCADRDAAERLAAEDPFADAGAYGSRSVVAFTPATPENDFLLRKV